MEDTRMFEEVLRERVKQIAGGSMLIRIHTFSGAAYKGRVVSVGHDCFVLLEDSQITIRFDRVESFTSSHIL